jgi:hypothetical protein
MKQITTLLLLAVTPLLASAKEYHVSVDGDDQNTAILALVILLPRWGDARLMMGGSEMSVGGRVRDW